MTLLQAAAMAQGAYYLVAGVWPWVHMRSFLAVTGPKVDLWLVKTVGALVIAIGIPLLTAGFSQRITPDILYLGVGAAALLAFVDAWFSLRGVISRIYLLDAAAELILIILWLAGRR